MKKTTVQQIDDTIIKRYPKDREIYFNNEITCLKLLKTNFSKKYYNIFPFPSLINIDYKNLSFTMSFCGQSLDCLKEKPKIRNIADQLNNIFFNLKKNNILYKDFYLANVCVLNESIFLIDFEVAFLMDFENYNNVITFNRGGYKWSKEFYNSYYNKPENLQIYNSLNSTSEKRQWKDKPWSISRMLLI